MRFFTVTILLALIASVAAVPYNPLKPREECAGSCTEHLDCSDSGRHPECYCDLSVVRLKRDVLYD